MTTTVSGGGGGHIAGLTSDNANGIAVAGGIAAGSSTVQAFLNYFGFQLIQDVSDPGSPLLEIDQTAESSQLHGNQSLVRLIRGFQPNFHTSAPIIYLENDDADSTADVYTYVGPSTGQGYRVGVQGGIGTLGHAPQTTPRTLAQSVITAITDANAKTAVQACANVLVDIGALTLT